MPKYEVKARRTIHYDTVYVEAIDEEEAEDKVNDMEANGELVEIQVLDAGLRMDIDEEWEGGDDK